MSISPGAASAGRTVTPDLFTSLFDDAAVFPPGNAAMVRAVPAHLGYHDRADAALIGPFLCPASRLGELRATLDGTSVLDVRVVVDTGSGGLADAAKAFTPNGHDDLFVLQGFEIPLRADADLGTAARRLVAAILAAELPDQLPVFVEVPISGAFPPALDVLAEYDVSAKLRTGGERADAHPSEAEVADFVLACLDREVSFKCTAGLHHAVRHTEPGTGFERHGFLNLVLGVSAALAGGDRAVVAAELADRDAAAVTDRVRQLSTDEAERVRRWFRSFGTCSVDEPIDDLVSLGLLAVPHEPTPRDHSLRSRSRGDPGVARYARDSAGTPGE